MGELDLTRTVAISLVTGPLMVVTVGGNVLVLLSFLVERSLRTPTNYLIASLAFTDVLIGSVSMSFYTVYNILNRWPLDKLLCDLWCSIDYTACLTSQYTVLFITLDRFCSVKFPTKYRQWRTKTISISVIVITWLIPSCLFFTIIFGWEKFTNKKRPEDFTNCEPLFVENVIFSTALSIAYYWTTLIVMIALYAGIYSVALKLQNKSIKRREVTSLTAAEHTETKRNSLYSMRHDKRQSIEQSSEAPISSKRKAFSHAYRDSRKNRFYGNRGLNKMHSVSGPNSAKENPSDLQQEMQSAPVPITSKQTNHESSTVSDEESCAKTIKQTKAKISGSHMALIQQMFFAKNFHRGGFICLN
ncbi:Serpentine type 7TM GPCR chemoreceptor Srsx [Cichlidogyrus casuarinus]|uniref:Serpentine type 7TM GPCR chemoreceptor Srsx n=1 Tax=Cichlidogyrus casuarinus TaxID=1844966 RepID=A0ABD2QC36_9PLAT